MVTTHISKTKLKNTNYDSSDRVDLLIIVAKIAPYKLFPPKTNPQFSAIIL